MATKKNAERQRLHDLAGSYSGVTLTWLDPDGTPEEASARATAKPILDGQFLRIEYASRVMGQANKGQFILGFDPGTKGYQAAWMDTFHSQQAIMACTADRKATSKEISVRGDYDAGDGTRWGWRTTFSQPDKKTLLIRAFNVPPGQKEQRAIETRLTRTR